jgi:hypothetical protein
MAAKLYVVTYEVRDLSYYPDKTQYAMFYIKKELVNAE